MSDISSDEKYDIMKKHIEEQAKWVEDHKEEIDEEIRKDKSGNCMSDWYPTLLTSGVKTPRTKIFETTADIIDAIDRKRPEGLINLVNNLKEGAKDFGYPCFLRSGLMSGKHNWDNCCYIKSEDDFERAVISIIDFSLMVSVKSIGVWVLREFLDIGAEIRVFGGMPLGKERRYFIDSGKVVCHHPYWPLKSIQNASDPNWKSYLKEMNKETKEEVKLLTELTTKVASVFKGAWSVDWMYVPSQNEWYCIDMALANKSYHWEGCKVKF